MFVITYTLIWLVCCLATCLLSFLLGRCARRLPVLDDHLPAVMTGAGTAASSSASRPGPGAMLAQSKSGRCPRAMASMPGRSLKQVRPEWSARAPIQQHPAH